MKATVDEMETAAEPTEKTLLPPSDGKKQRRISPLASVQLSVFLMTLMAATILLGAWCPQEAQVGQEKVFEAFDRPTAEFLVRSGITDIFHSPWFLTITALMTVNMVVVSFQRVFPKLKTYNREMPFFGGKEIGKLACNRKIDLRAGSQTAVLGQLTAALTRLGYKVKFSQGQGLKAEFGRLGRLAPTVTHIGLLSLLAGITITSWTGFNGFRPVLLEESLSFDDAKHASLWIGKMPA
ncbi:MAG: cytochrome c biogenesis protein ResB, partial [Candidatus Obscuribacter sp.]|nr:cytochrome c biogenesis protein ResB [Candidatus Obscuribacter sp.]